jgi:hypothetical protein
MASIKLASQTVLPFELDKTERRIMTLAPGGSCLEGRLR